MGYSVQQLDEEIQKAEKKLDDLREERDHFNSLAPRYRIATFLHEALCQANHTDGCGWYYNENWNEWSRKKYLKMADGFLAIIGENEIKKIVQVLKQ